MRRSLVVKIFMVRKMQKRPGTVRDVCLLGGVGVNVYKMLEK